MCEMEKVTNAAPIRKIIRRITEESIMKMQQHPRPISGKNNRFFGIFRTQNEGLDRVPHTIIRGGKLFMGATSCLPQKNVTKARFFWFGDERLIYSAPDYMLSFDSVPFFDVFLGRTCADK